MTMTMEEKAASFPCRLRCMRECECVATIDALRKRERVTDEDNGRGGVSTHHFPVLFPFNV